MAYQGSPADYMKERRIAVNSASRDAATITAGLFSGAQVGPGSDTDQGLDQRAVQMYFRVFEGIKELLLPELGIPVLEDPVEAVKEKFAGDPSDPFNTVGAPESVDAFPGRSDPPAPVVPTAVTPPPPQMVQPQPSAPSMPQPQAAASEDDLWRQLFAEWDAGNVQSFYDNRWDTRVNAPAASPSFKHKESKKALWLKTNYPKAKDQWIYDGIAARGILA